MKKINKLKMKIDRLHLENQKKCTFRLKLRNY